VSLSTLVWNMNNMNALVHFGTILWSYRRHVPHLATPMSFVGHNGGHIRRQNMVLSGQNRCIYLCVYVRFHSASTRQENALVQDNVVAVSSVQPSMTISVFLKVFVYTLASVYSSHRLSTSLSV